MTLIGARLIEGLGAAGPAPDEATLEALERAFPPGPAAGSRYPDAGLAGLDSER